MTEQEQKAFTAMREEIIKHIEDAIKDHCSGSDLYMSALVAAGKIQALTAANAVQPQFMGFDVVVDPTMKPNEMKMVQPQAHGEALIEMFGKHPHLVKEFNRYDPSAAHPQATEPAEKEDPLQGAVDWLLQADGEFFAVATVQRTLRIGYNRAKRLADIARERAAASEAHHE